MRRFLFISLLSLFFFGFSQAYGQISASITEGCAPLASVQFTNFFDNPTNILWNFDDGATSNLPNPVRSFAQAGIYNVSFSATVGGTEVSESITITVFANPIVDFNAVPVGVCLGTPTVFQDASTGGSGSDIVNWQWSFGDGSAIVSGVANPEHLYQATGTYAVTLIVTDGNGCSSSITSPSAAAVSEPPNLNVSTVPSPAVACEPPFDVSFINNSTSNSPVSGDLSFNWDFGNGQTSNLAAPETVTYITEGSFTINVTATDNFGCSASQSIPVSVQQPVADFEIIGAENDTVCSLIEIVNNGSPGVFLYGDGTAGTSLIHQYNVGGTYTITLNINAAGCSAQTSQTVFVEIPNASILSEPGFSCSKPANFSYTLESEFNLSTVNWELSNGGTASGFAAFQQVDYEGPGEYDINGLVEQTTSVNFTTANGCTGTASIQDSIAMPNALFYPDKTNGCAPLTLNFRDESANYEIDEIVDWHWVFGDGEILDSDVSTNPMHIYTEPGEYEVFLVVTNGAGCIDTSFIHIIKVGVPITPSFTFSPNPVCPGEAVTIVNTSPNQDLIDAYNYSGDNNTLSNCGTNDIPVLFFDDVTGVFPITQSAEYNGCFASFSQNITVNGPIGKVSYGCNCDTPLEYSFIAEVSDADSWTWDFGDGTTVPNSTEANIIHAFSESGDYWVTLTSFSSTSGCGPYVDSVLVEVRELVPNFTLPAFGCAETGLFFNASSSEDVGSTNDGCCRNYTWKFGADARPIKTLVPFITYSFPQGGDYAVTLIVKDDNGCLRSVTKDIGIYEVSAQYSADTLYGCPPLEVNFTDLSQADTTIASWSWTFDDGNSSVEQNPNHLYETVVFNGNNQPQPFNVSLTVVDVLGCSSTISDLVIQPLGPNPSFAPISSTQICAGEEVLFQPTGSNPDFHTYNWDYGNGNTSDGPAGESAYAQAGTYSVSLLVTDSVGCSRSETMNIVQVQDYPQAIIEPDYLDDDILCYPALVSFTDASVVDVFASRTWDLGQGNPILPNEEVGTAYLLPGIYTVQLTVNTTFGCSDTTSLDVLVEGPLAEIVLDPLEICPGGTIEISFTDTSDVAYWQFDFGDGNEIANQAPVIYGFDDDFIPLSGETVLSLVMFSPDSACSSARTVNLGIEEVIADFNRNEEASAIDSVHCVGIADVFTNNSSDNATLYQWSISTGESFSSQNIPSIELPVGNHIVELIVESDLGCVDTVQKTMLINPLPEPTVNSGRICRDESILLIATGGVSYAWSPSSGLSDITGSEVLASPMDSIVYTVTVTDTNFCVNTAFSEIAVIQAHPSTEVDTTLRIGDSDFAGFDLGEGYSYQWSPNIYLECDTCAETTFTPLESTLYTLTVSDSIGCFDIESYFFFEILDAASVVIPQAFTPNGDGVNDVVYAEGWGVENMVSFKIYNRWGELVFETEDYTQGWDGTYKGVIQNPDSYAYVVVSKSLVREIPETFKGFIDLIR